MVRARAICNREIRSATTSYQGCAWRGNIYYKTSMQQSIVEDMSCGSLAVCLLITTTTTVLSERNKTR